MVANDQWRGLELWWLDQVVLSPRSAFVALKRQHEYSTGSWLLRVMAKLGDELMARGKGSGNAVKSESDKSWTNFVTVSLAGVVWADIEHALGDPDTVFDGLADLLVRGYRVGLSFNQGNDAFICSLTCRNDADPNNGCTLTSFADTWFRALQTTLYKHYYVSAQVWPKDGAKGQTATFG